MRAGRVRDMLKFVHSLLCSRNSPRVNSTHRSINWNSVYMFHTIYIYSALCLHTLSYVGVIITNASASLCYVFRARLVSEILAVTWEGCEIKEVCWEVIETCPTTRVNRNVIQLLVRMRKRSTMRETRCSELKKPFASRFAWKIICSNKYVYTRIHLFQRYTSSYYIISIKSITIFQKVLFSRLKSDTRLLR